MRRVIIALLFAASVAHGQDWRILGQMFTEPCGGLVTLGGAVNLDGSLASFYETAAALSNAASATISCWIKTSSSHSGRYFVHERSALSSGISIGQALNTDGTDKNNGRVCASYRSSAGTFLMLEGPVVTNNVWTLLVFVVAGSNATFYVDGIATNAASNVSTSHTFSAAGAVRHCIGGLVGAAAPAYFAGLIDDLAVFKNRPFTSSEVSELYNRGIGKQVTSLSTGTNGLVRYWKMDDGLTNPAASNAYDSASGTVAAGVSIGAGVWTNGIVPLP